MKPAIKLSSIAPDARSSTGGYRVPKGFVVSADPRISNRDPELHADSAAGTKCELTQEENTVFVDVLWHVMCFLLGKLDLMQVSGPPTVPNRFV